jgi:hypothetical protein
MLDLFRFNKTNLQDYADCPRRFQLRYVLMQPWPALIVEPAGEAENQMQRGVDLHRLAHQAALGIDADRLTAMIHDPLLATWWATFRSHPPRDLPGTVRRTETVVSAPLVPDSPQDRAGHRLVAKFDLVALEPGERFVIVDWKTMLKRPPRENLARRLETVVYRYLAVEAGAALNGGQRPRPEQVEMVYWFAADGGRTEQLSYDAGQHAAARERLASLVTSIAGQHETVWPLTGDERQCRFCNYRSLCERGVEPGFLNELDDDLEPDEPEIDLEQIAELAF